MAHAIRSIDHAEIRRWVEQRGGHPAHVKASGRDGDPGILRIDYPGFRGEQSLEALDWDDWFAAFEANQLAFLYQDEHESRFSKLVRRRGDEDEGGETEPEEEAHDAGSKRWQSRSSRVTLNDASREELDALFGIGPALADRIVRHRRRHGRLQGPDDLRSIDGIDGATAKLIAEQASFE